MYSMHELDCKGKDLGGGGKTMKTSLTHSLNHSPIDPQESARVFIRVYIRLIFDSKL